MISRLLPAFFALLGFFSLPLGASVKPIHVLDTFFDSVESRTFAWFWDSTNPENGMVPDRTPEKPFASVAAVGFGLTAIPVGIERGYVTREEGIERVLATLRFLRDAPQGDAASGVIGYKGFYYHFLDMDTGTRYQKVELSTIDTALCMMGVLFCQSYFDGATADEVAIREIAEELYQRVEWDWFTIRKSLLCMGWHPEHGFINADYKGYDEAMFLYILALGSPTHPVPESAWTDFTSSNRWADFMGQEHIVFAPLFGHQYSHVWIDFRGIQDELMREKGIDYFENSRRATIAQRAYAIQNPLGWKDYGPLIWGFTACDGPASIKHEYNGELRTFMTYNARGADADYISDDGTIAPTAAGGSLPFAPEHTVSALMEMVRRYGKHVYNEHGFVDAFNPSFDFEGVAPEKGTVVPYVGWFDSDQLGIDQGPILLMIENYRTGLVWETMKRNPHILRGLQRAGFKGGWLDGTSETDSQ